MNHDRSIPNAQTIQRHQLPNGITVLIYENPESRTVVMQGTIWAGSSRENRATAGLASLTSDMLLRGTEKRDFERIYEEMESLGASVEFGSGYQSAEFSANGLAEDFDLLLDLITQSLRYPTFEADELEQIRSETVTQILMRQNDTRSMAQLAFHEALYGLEHPYGRSVTGYLDSVQALTIEDVRAFHAAHYSPQGMVIVVVGGISAETVLARINEQLGDWHNPRYQPPPPLPTAVRPQGVHRVEQVMADKSQADLLIGLPGPKRSAPDYLAVRVANTVLGVFGMMGRLGKSVRERQGLAYYVRSVLQGGLGEHPWYVSTGVVPEKLEQAILSIQAEIRRMQTERVPREELADSQAYLVGSLPMSVETNEGKASLIEDMEIYGLGLDYLVNYPDMIQAISAEDLLLAANRYFSADDVVISIAGPAHPVSEAQTEEATE